MSKLPMVRTRRLIALASIASVALLVGLNVLDSERDRPASAGELSAAGSGARPGRER